MFLFHLLCQPETFGLQSARGCVPCNCNSYVHTSSRKFLKVRVQSRALPHPLGLPSFSPPMRVRGLHLSYRKQKKNRLPLNVTPDLPPTFILSLRSRCRQHRGPGARGARRAGRLHRRREVMSKQVIIMRWALQKLTRLSRRSVTHSSASRYSRESSSHTCSRSTAKREKPMGTRARMRGGRPLPTRGRGDRAGHSRACPAPGGEGSGALSTLQWSWGGPLPLRGSHLGGVYTSAYYAARSPRVSPARAMQLPLGAPRPCVWAPPSSVSQTHWAFGKDDDDKIHINDYGSSHSEDKPRFMTWLLSLAVTPAQSKK